MQKDTDAIIDAHVSVYTVSFLLLDGGIPKLLGSGTLASFKSNQGVLTCGHVAKALPDNRDFGIGQFGLPDKRDQRMTLPGAQTVAHAAICYNGPSRDGPDLAFIPIPQKYFSELKARGSVVDLESPNLAVCEKLEDVEVLEILAGSLKELTPPVSSQENKNTISVKGLACPGRISDRWTIEEWDYLRFQPQEQDELPKSFGATSGGGIWRIHVRKNDEGKYVALGSILAGAAFWEEPRDVSIDIIGHGPDSIYRTLLSKLHQRWP